MANRFVVFADLRPPGWTCAGDPRATCAIREPFALPGAFEGAGFQHGTAHPMKTRTTHASLAQFTAIGLVLGPCVCLAALLGAAGCASKPQAQVPIRTVPVGALVLGAGGGAQDALDGRRDAALGASRLPTVRVVESAEHRVADRQWEYDGRPYSRYRATTLTRERLIR